MLCGSTFKSLSETEDSKCFFFLIVDGLSNQGTIQFSKYLSYAPYEPGTGLGIKQPVLKQNELFFSYKNTHGASLEN